MTREPQEGEGTFAVDAALLRDRLQAMLALAPLQRVLVIGRGKSGTTWLGRILRWHPNVFFRGERKLVERTGGYEPILRLLIDDQAMEEWGRRSSFRLGLQPWRMGPTLWRVVDDYLTAAAILASRQDPAGITHLGDKLALLHREDAEQILPALDLAFPGYRALHIVRDGRDAAVSGMFHVYRNKVVKGGATDALIKDKVEGVLHGEAERLFTDQHLQLRAESWIGVTTAIDDRLRSSLGDRYLLLRYEDLLADTPGTIERVFAFAGLPHPPEIIAQVMERTSFKKLSGGRPSGELDVSSGQRKGEAGDWVNYFTRRDRALFAAAAQPALERFGYETDAAWVNGP